jgi:hypothetical protein
MSKKSGLSKRLKSFFRRDSSRSAASATAQSQHSITTAVGASEVTASEPLESGEARPNVSERHLLPLVQLLG